MQLHDWNAINVELLLAQGTFRREKASALQLTQKSLQWSQIVWVECWVGAQLRLFYLRRRYSVVHVLEEKRSAMSD